MNPSVMICTPCKDGRVDINYALSLAATCQAFMMAGIRYRISTACTSSIDSGRSVLATMFLESECDYLLFLDDDMAWASDLPLRMLNENVDIVGVPYRKKKMKFEYTVLHKKVVASIQDRPWMVMVDAIGMGMALIHRRVFEKISLSVPEYFCEGSDDKPKFLFFRHELVKDEADGRMKYESEDFHFCRLARDNGFEIFAYADEPIAHIGRTAFCGCYSDHIGVDTAHGFTSERPRNPVNMVGVEI